MRSWSKGLKEGNRPVGDSEIHTLKHIKYNPDIDQIEATRALTTTLNSLYLGGQHKMSSGAENIFFNNITSDIAWYPMWGGLKNQKYLENRDSSGFIYPSARIYSPDLLEIGATGPEVFPYQWHESGSSAVATASVSAHGVRVRPRYDIDTDVKVKYIVRSGGAEGVAIYEQVFKFEELHKGGELVDIWFDHPLDVHQGMITWAGFVVETSKKSDEYIPIVVSISELQKDYVYLYYRRFEDKDLAMKEDVGVHSVYVTDITTRDGEAIALERLEQPNEEQVISFNTNSLQLTVAVEWDRTDKFQGTVKVNDIEVIPTYAFDGTYKGSVDIDVAILDEVITITKGDKVEEVPMIRLQIPQILTATLSDIYPGTQTELKAGDVVQISVTTDLPVSRLDYISGLASGTNATFPEGTEFTVDLTVTATTTLTQLIAQDITVTDIATSEAFTTTNSMFHNNLYPVITYGSITYPTGQQALKGNEQATVVNQVLNADVINYIGTEVSIPNPTTLEDKVVTRTSGQYNITTNNFTINATRTANDASSSKGTVVWIADQVPIVSIGTPNHLRSGGNDGTSVQDHSVTITANQRVLPPVTLDASIGSWQGSWVNMITSLTRDLRIHDNDVKGTGVFSNLSVFNLAGIEINIASGLTYECQGFVSRVVDIAPFGWQATINVELTNSDNLIADWSYKEGIEYINSTTRPQVDKYNLKPNGSIKLLDKSATDSSSSDTIFTIGET